MRNLKQFFEYLHDIDYPYLVMRNWENLPDHVETGIHSDLDLLIYDREHLLEVFPDLEQVYPSPRVQYKLYLDNGEYIQMDLRELGDGYYPLAFAEAMLNTREYNPLGFFTPNPIHHRIGLAYHAVHHKNQNNYEKYLGKNSIKNMLEALKENKELGWSQPSDPTVGSYNSYLSGSTSVVSNEGDYVEKKQTRYKEYDLIDNEERILKMLDNPHFPKLIGRVEDNIRIEHCGEPLGISNLPEDYLEQFKEIIAALDSAGIVHRDVRLDNLMLKDGIIKLLDFGWARLVSESDGKHPDLLGYPNRCPIEFSDRYSFNRIVRQLEEEKEEMLCQKTN